MHFLGLAKVTAAVSRRARRFLWQATACQACPDPDAKLSTTLEILEAEVLKLAPADRSRLLERLIASLDPDPEVEEAWEREADRREAELESGSVASVPGHEAIALYEQGFRGDLLAPPRGRAGRRGEVTRAAFES